jgi:hypothetical protein
MIVPFVDLGKIFDRRVSKGQMDEMGIDPSLPKGWPATSMIHSRNKHRMSRCDNPLILAHLIMHSSLAASQFQGQACDLCVI